MRIVLVCSGNTCRSPMAEALIRRELAARGLGDIDVSSAGVYAFDGEGAARDAVREMASRGLDIGGHRSRQATARNLSGALVLCMTDAHLRSLQHMVGPVDAHNYLEYAGLDGDVADPFGRGPDAYRQIAEQLEDAAVRIAERIADQRKG